jgi:hypothetical protein
MQQLHFDFGEVQDKRAVYYSDALPIICAGQKLYSKKNYNEKLATGKPI